MAAGYRGRSFFSGLALPRIVPNRSVRAGPVQSRTKAHLWLMGPLWCG